MIRHNPKPRLAPPPPPDLDAVPDRKLDIAGEPPVVSIRGDGRHPFVYKKMVIGPRGPARPRDGDLVRVVDRDGIPVGYGLWNSRSQINLRMLWRERETPDAAAWAARIDRAIALRRDGLGLGLGVNSEADAYRVVHSEADDLSGLIVDRYDDVLSVEIFSLGMYQRIGPILDLLAARLGTKHFRVRVDERIALAEDFPGRPLASPNLPPRVTIRENGVRFRVQFEGSHKTGFFCDQRENRLHLTRFTPGRSMLDACCYTGGFGLYALVKGGATEVIGVDLDEKAVAIAKENGRANQVRPSFLHADAFGYMRQAGINARKFGVVALDPPKLIPGRLDISAGKRKYFDLNVLAMRLVEPDGMLMTCSCSGLLPVEEFLILLRAAARKAGRSAQILAVTGPGADHPVGLEALEGSYLKVAWLRMGASVSTAGVSDDLEGDDPAVDPD